MATRKRVSFASSVVGELRKRAASDAEEEAEPKKKKLASHRIWNEEDVLALLKELVDYRAKTGHDDLNTDWDAFFNFVQVIRRIDGGNNPFSDSQAFEFAMMIWGQNDANGGMDKAHQTEISEDAEVPNAEPVNDNGGGKSSFDGNADKITENRTVCDNGAAKSNLDGGKSLKKENRAIEKESHDDELCAVCDAFETMVSQGLSDYQKKLLLGKLMKLGTEKIKDLSNEWIALCAEEGKLNIKKLRFSAKLAETSIDG